MTDGKQKDHSMLEKLTDESACIGRETTRERREYVENMASDASRKLRAIVNINHDRNLQAVYSILLHVGAVRIRMSFVTLLFRQAACHRCSRRVRCVFVTPRAQFNLLVLLYSSGILWCGCTTKPCRSLIMR